MPETRLEWFLFIAGLVVIGVLGVAIAFGRAKAAPDAAPVTTVLATSTASDPSTDRTPSTRTRTETLPATTAGETTTASTSAGTTTTATTTSRGTARLQLRALQDTWVSVRTERRDGPVVFEGTMAAGDTRTFSAPLLWVRFGAASNVAATLNGKALELPAGTYSVPITSSGRGAAQA